MGVCCIVFDIDGMFEFFMNFLNIEKKKILRFFFFQYFMFSSRFMLFPTFTKTILSHFTFYAIFDNSFSKIKKKKKLKNTPSLTG